MKSASGRYVDSAEEATAIFGNRGVRFVSTRTVTEAIPIVVVLETELSKVWKLNLIL